MYISALIKNTGASKYLKLDDQILAINEVNYSNDAEIKECDFVGNPLVDNSLDIISIKVLRDGKEHNFDLHKKVLLP